MGYLPFWFTSDPSKLGDPPLREPVPTDWKIVVAFLCLILFISGIWTKKIFNVFGFFELRLHHNEDHWLQNCFFADYNLSPFRFILSMVFWGTSGAIFLVQLMLSYFKYQQRRK